MLRIKQNVLVTVLGVLLTQGVVFAQESHEVMQQSKYASEQKTKRVSAASKTDSVIVETVKGMHELFFKALNAQLSQNGVDVRKLDEERQKILAMSIANPQDALVQAQSFRKHYLPIIREAMLKIGVDAGGVSVALGDDNLQSNDVERLTQLISMGDDVSSAQEKTIINAAGACNGWLVQWICHYGPLVNGRPTCDMIHLTRGTGGLHIQGTGIDWVGTGSSYVGSPNHVELDGSILMRMRGEPRDGLQPNQPRGGIYSIVRHSQPLVDVTQLNDVGLICVQTRAQLGISVSNSVGAFGSSAATASTRMLAKAGGLGLDAVRPSTVSVSSSACAGSQYFAQRAAGFNTTLIPVTNVPFTEINPNLRVNMSWHPSNSGVVRIEDSCWLEGIPSVLRTEFGTLPIEVGYSTVFQHDAWNGTPASLVYLNITDIGLVLFRLNR